MIKTLMPLFVAALFFMPPQEDLRIESRTLPATVALGGDGQLRIKLSLRPGVRISSHPEFMIRFDESEQVSFAKVFFTGSDLNLQRIQEGESVYLDLQREIEIPFRVNPDAFLGRPTIKGAIVYTILSPDNWYIKTIQKFRTAFGTRRPTPADRKPPRGKTDAGSVTASLDRGTSGSFPPGPRRGRGSG